MGVEIFIQHFSGLLAEVPPLPPADREPPSAVFAMALTSISPGSLCVCARARVYACEGQG